MKDPFLEMFKKEDKKKAKREKETPGKIRKYKPLKSHTRNKKTGYFGVSRNEN